jgi:hypothetical protein
LQPHHKLVPCLPAVDSLVFKQVTRHVLQL